MDSVIASTSTGGRRRAADIYTNVRKTVKLTVEQARPFFSSNILLCVVVILTGIQFIPSIITLHADIQESLQNSNVHITAGFSIGFISLILVDLLFDFAMGAQDELWVSRSCYFWISFIYSIIIVTVPSLGPYYILYNSAALVFFIGRSFVDLCIHDFSSTWTMTRCICLLCLIACSNLMTNYSLHTEFADVSLIREAGIAIALLYIIGLSALFVVSIQNIFRKHSATTAMSLVKDLTHQEFITLLISSTLIITTIPLAIMPLLVNVYSPVYICSEMLIRVFLVTSLALFPSLSLKHRASTLQADLNLRSLFVKNVAHEIRTPLNIAVAGLDILRRSRIANPEEHEMIIEILDSCEAAVTILDDLLSYEKFSSGAMKLDKHEVCAKDLINTAASLFKIQARGKNIELSILENANCISADVNISIDYGKITQVLRNFISNAIKFTPDHGKVQVIAFERKRASSIHHLSGDNSCVVMQVIDSGVGMTPAQLSRIFNEIVQFDANKNQGGKGSGIGLWVSKKIVDLHGGKVRVTSEGPGCGCVFELELPVFNPVFNLGFTNKKIHPHDEDNSSKRRVISRMIESHHSSKKDNKTIIPHFSSRALALASTGIGPLFTASGKMTDTKSQAVLSAEHHQLYENLHVLVVDDSRVNRRFTRKLLAPCGFRIDEAEDGLVCLSKVQQSYSSEAGPYDFILMDSEMPNMNGMKATEELKKAKFKGIIVGITGNASHEDIEAFLTAGANDVLVKPVTFNQLDACFSEQLEKKKRRGDSLV